MKGTITVASESTSLKSNFYIDLLTRSLKEFDVSIQSLGGKKIDNNIDIIHLHWPENYLRNFRKRKIKIALVKFIIQLVRARLQRIPIVWTVHNTQPHEKHAGKLVYSTFYWILTRLVNGCIYMCESSKTQAEQAYPQLSSKPNTIIPHGHYESTVIIPDSISDARKMIGVPEDSTLISHCGVIRGYKNTLKLAEEFLQLDLKNTYLIIAGNCRSKKLARKITNISETTDSIIFINEVIPEELMSAIIYASDISALPYKRVTNSGAAIYSLSLRTPVFAPRTGVFSDLHQCHSEWIYLYDPPLTMQSLEKGIAWAKSHKPTEPLDLSAYDWHLIAEQTRNFYDSLLSTVSGSYENA